MSLKKSLLKHIIATIKDGFEMKGRKVESFIEDMLLCMKRILKYTAGISYDEFKADEITTDAVSRNFVVLGEATIHIPYEIKDKYCNINWGQFEEVKNHIIQSYFNIDYIILWNLISVIPEQMKLLEELYRNE